ncbi:unnamed protein product, partial [Symbiodinium sp. CCMP2456]
ISSRHTDNLAWKGRVNEGFVRYHDEICICSDLNYDILDIVNVDERGVPFGQLLRTLGAQSRIDFVLFASPSMQTTDDRAAELASELDLSMKDLDMHAIENVKRYEALGPENLPSKLLMAISYFRKRNSALYTQGLPLQVGHAEVRWEEVGHRTWEGEHARAFFGYWGHAARYDLFASIPIAVMLRVRGPEWHFANGPFVRRLVGRTKSLCADVSRFLQNAWEKYLKDTGASPPTSWLRGASDRDTWKAFTQHWTTQTGVQSNKFYSEPPEAVDLRGCQLVQHGDKFSLLHTGHPPIEEPFAVSFLRLSEAPDSGPDDHDEEHVLRVYSDGSASNNRKGQAGDGGGAVVLLPPYGDTSKMTVCHFKIRRPCTNIQAELQAAAQALRMIRTFRLKHPHIPVCYCTDSQYVLQILEGAFQGTHYASVTNEIICLWSELCVTVEARHVKAHSNILLNEVADRFAKIAMDHGDNQAARTQFAGMSQAGNTVDYMQDFVQKAHAVAVLPQTSTLGLFAIMGVVGLVILWGFQSSFLRSLMTSLQGSVKVHITNIMEDTQKLLLDYVKEHLGARIEELAAKVETLEQREASPPDTEALQSKLAADTEALQSKLAADTEALQSKLAALEKAVKDLAAGPAALDVSGLGSDIWDSLRPVLSQWSQGQTSKMQKAVEDWLKDKATAPSSSKDGSPDASEEIKQLKDSMKAVQTLAKHLCDEKHTALTDMLQEVQKLANDKHAEAQASANEKHAALVTKVDNVTGYLREDHALIVRLKDKNEELSKDALGHRSAILAEIKNVTPVIRRGADMIERTLNLLAKGDPSPWEQELKKVADDTSHTLHWVAGQEEELQSKVTKIESLITGLLDNVNLGQAQ